MASQDLYRSGAGGDLTARAEYASSACISLFMAPMKILRALPVLAALAIPLVWVPTALAPSAASATTVYSIPAAQDSRDSATAQASDDAQLANDVLRELQAKYRHLEGVTVSVGETPNGAQAVAFYKDGQIVISSEHTTSIEAILAHEVWHVIDWRDNGQLDWGEDLPPGNSYTYLKR